MKTRTFIDQVDVIVRSGKGGDGSASFRREALVAFGGPDGGDGGRGGDVVLRGSTHVNSLISLYFDPKLYAEDGVPGSGKRCFGRRGKDLVVDVPCGTLATDADTGLVVADIVSPGQRVVVAKGGAGGYGNVHFKSAVNQAPTEHTPGGPAEELRLHLELKTIADAGLLGFPNAGKSSILTALSSATPKIASYPFTTLNPIVGTIEYDDFAQIRMADVPGIIEGASQGVGLGLAFLKHLERARVLVYMIDMAGTDNRKPWDDYRVLSEEIAAFNAELPERPFLVVANKMDQAAARKNLKRFVKETGVTPIALSCTPTLKDLREYADLKDYPGEVGLDAFKSALRKLVNPKPRAHQHLESAPPPLSEMPDTTGDEIPAEALKFATFLKLDAPKKKSHPSRGNIH
ncbi:MAG: GTPase ObgE [Kiritimatiellae bacterium]|nr:GTPase ObgE [Kiritimatiellia bacterium]